MVGRRGVRATVGAFGVGLAALLAPVAGADPAPPAEPVVLPAPDAPAVAPLTPPDGVSHLPSPENLPPGTTQTVPEHPKLGYLREIWQAVRGKDVSASDALLLIAQRPGDAGKIADSVPSNQGPTAPPAVAADPAPGGAPAEVPAPAPAPPAAAPDRPASPAAPAPSATPGEAPVRPAAQPAAEPAQPAPDRAAAAPAPAPATPTANKRPMPAPAVPVPATPPAS